ncbi:MAG: excinuclease ABC subunit UvrA [Bacteroidales bacterium]|nr:excinuclease ABC subunit UvrA [Bacteroidales bacterium]
MADSEEKDYIVVKGARVNNLQNVSVKIPRNKLTVITGLSGSGKSSLAFDTLYAEGQRRYVESLSAYARQFLGRMQKPEVDFIHGIPPAVALEQKVNTSNPRSTVGTTTEIYEYLKILYARIGRTISPVSGQEVKKHTVTDVVDAVLSFPDGEKILVISPVTVETRLLEAQLAELRKEGLSRILVDGEVKRIEELDDAQKAVRDGRVFVVVDRLVVNKSDEDFVSRCSDSVQSALLIGKGECYLLQVDSTKWLEFSIRFEADGITFEEPNIHMFSFNNPLGACPSCQGFGKTIGIDPDLVIPNKNLSVFSDAVACWRGASFGEWKNDFVRKAVKYNFPVHRPYKDLNAEQRKLLWEGDGRYLNGINQFFEYLDLNSYKMHYRILASRFKGKTTCPTCGGTRLKKEASYVKVAGKAITELVDMQIDHLKDFFEQLKLTEYEWKIASRVVTEIRNRIDFLLQVGLGYLTLNRLSNTLSGGETQRVNLATALGGSLVGALYILDEPSIGLHPHDNNLLINVLHRLKNLGNTVVVVEHDEDIIRSADYIIDMGPLAGRLGGQVVFQGAPGDLAKHNESLTAQYMTQQRSIELPSKRRKWTHFIELKGVRHNNLKDFNVRFPLNVMTVVTGVSGSGKSTLIKQILYPALRREILGMGDKPGEFDELSGDWQMIEGVEYVDQEPLGKSTRSNPATAIKAFDEIRKLFSDTAHKMHYDYPPSYFSFNVEGGRCEECQGEGIITVPMQFMADIILTCESCKGKRFKEEILEVKYHGKNIFEVLEMTVDEAIDFFQKGNNSTCNKIMDKLKTLSDVGLGYVKLGQSTSTLSGGENQRLKLASYITNASSIKGHTLFLFDEPTTGLHVHDIKKLLEALNVIIRKGHTVIIIEHNLEVIKSADWIIDLGPTGGEKGGYLLFEGTPEEIVFCKESITGKYLLPKLEKFKSFS